jgi:hypothetical protein
VTNRLTTELAHASRQCCVGMCLRSPLLFMQIALKNYDPQRDKRFSGTFKLPTIPK